MSHFVTENRYIVPLGTAAVLGTGAVAGTAAVAGVGYAGYKTGEWLLDKVTGDGVEANVASKVNLANTDLTNTILNSDEDLMIADLLSNDIMDEFGDISDLGEFV